MPFHNKLKVGYVVLIKCPLKPRVFCVLGGVVELVMTARVKQGGTVQVHVLKYLLPLELSLLADEEEVILFLSSDGAAAVPAHPSYSGEKEVVWLCLICNAPQDMICNDECDSCCHFGCVEVQSSPPPAKKNCTVPIVHT